MCTHWIFSTISARQLQIRREISPFPSHWEFKVDIQCIICLWKKSGQHWWNVIGFVSWPNKYEYVLNLSKDRIKYSWNLVNWINKRGKEKKTLCDTYWSFEQTTRILPRIYIRLDEIDHNLYSLYKFHILRKRKRQEKVDGINSSNM